MKMLEVEIRVLAAWNNHGVRRLHAALRTVQINTEASTVKLL